MDFAKLATSQWQSFDLDSCGINILELCYVQLIPNWNVVFCRKIWCKQELCSSYIYVGLQIIIGAFDVFSITPPKIYLPLTINVRMSEADV